jgi:hypothetical protein
MLRVTIAGFVAAHTSIPVKSSFCFCEQYQFWSILPQGTQNINTFLYCVQELYQGLKEKGIFFFASMNQFE